MSRIMVVILIYNRHKYIDLIFVECTCSTSISEVVNRISNDVISVYFRSIPDTLTHIFSEAVRS
jgi:hypothetical protein